MPAVGAHSSGQSPGSKRRPRHPRTGLSSARTVVRFPLGPQGAQLRIPGSFYPLLRDARGQPGLGKLSDTGQKPMLLSGVAVMVEGGGNWRDPRYCSSTVRAEWISFVLSLERGKSTGWGRGRGLRRRD